MPQPRPRHGTNTRSLTLAVLTPVPLKSLFTLYRYETSSRRTSERFMTLQARRDFNALAAFLQ